MHRDSRAQIYLQTYRLYILVILVTVLVWLVLHKDATFQYAHAHKSAGQGPSVSAAALTLHKSLLAAQTHCEPLHDYLWSYAKLGCRGPDSHVCLPL